MANLRGIEKLLRGAADRVETAHNERVKKAALAMVVYLVNQTPVDTSQALSNWIVSLGSVDRSFIGPWVPGIAGSTRAASAAEAIALARLILADKKAGQRVFIVNNAPYIRRLNEGSSRQHPGGFVQAAAIVGRASFRSK